MLTSTVLYADVISIFVIRKAKKSMKIVNIDGENFHIFWTTWREIFRKDVTGMIILKVTKNQGFTFSL